MCELSFSNANNPHSHEQCFSISLLVSDLMLLFSFVISHPLYFLYFIFFSPYIFKLLSFLSPLFITTFLLLLALLTVSPALLLSPDSSSSSSLLHKCFSVLDKLKMRPIVTADDQSSEDFRCFEELEAYKIVFEAVTFEVGDEEREPMEMESEEKHCLPDFEKVPEEERVGMGEGKEKLLKDEVEKTVGGDPDKEKLTAGVSEGIGSKKVGEIPPLRGISTANGGDCNSNKEGEDYYYHCYSSPRKEMESSGSGSGEMTLDSSNLGSFGSMRKEREWRRTLACKLFEERHNNVEGGEGMDSLWETYEADPGEVMAGSAKKSKKKGVEKEEEEEDDEIEDEEDGMDRQLCCLQALKFSTAKMNLGMGRPNLLKITKAFKGIGWLHQQVSKHGRRAHRRH